MNFKNKILAAGLAAIVAVFGISLTTTSIAQAQTSNTPAQSITIEQLQQLVLKLQEQIAYIIQLLGQQRPVCGNSVCETAKGETAASCPADCVSKPISLKATASDLPVGGPYVYHKDQKVLVYGLNIGATGSDMDVQRITLQFTGAPYEFFSNIYLYSGNNELIAISPINHDNVGKTSDGNYQMTLANFKNKFLVPAGTSKLLNVKVDVWAPNHPASKIYINTASSGIRAVDRANKNHYTEELGGKMIIVNSNLLQPIACGNGTCEASETATNCPADCCRSQQIAALQAQLGALIEATQRPSTTPAEQLAQQIAALQYQLSLSMANCNTALFCGNSTCETGETAVSCPADCETKANFTPVAIVTSYTQPTSVSPATLTSTFNVQVTAKNGDVYLPKSGAFTVAVLKDNETDLTKHHLGTIYSQPTGTAVVGNSYKIAKDTTATFAAKADFSTATAGYYRLQMAIISWSTLDGGGYTNWTPSLPSIWSGQTIYLNGSNPGVCGNGTCEAGENVSNCPKDCNTISCIGVNEGHEIKQGQSCCAGLKPLVEKYAQATENWSCVPMPTSRTLCANCGNGICGPGESYCSCPQDCCTPGTISGCKVCGTNPSQVWIDDNTKCPIGQICSEGKCLPTTTCGNGTCEAGETANTCPADCGTRKPTCSDSDNGASYYTPGKLTEINQHTNWIANSYPDMCVTDVAGANLAEAVCEKRSDGYYYGSQKYYNCPKGCKDGACVPELNCTNECPAAGTKQCESAGFFKTCGNYDTDSCLEWSSVTACTNNQICSAGNCVNTCGDGTCSPNETTNTCPADCGTVSELIPSYADVLSCITSTGETKPTTRTSNYANWFIWNNCAKEKHYLIANSASSLPQPIVFNAYIDSCANCTCNYLNFSVFEYVNGNWNAVANIKSGLAGNYYYQPSSEVSKIKVVASSCFYLKVYQGSKSSLSQKFPNMTGL